uniref:Uncharacterized protein n=1 Tax=Cacopsylla melanoneura TaxID=428564 RepID=A0A8D8Q1J7_9HEMI
MLVERIYLKSIDSTNNLASQVLPWWCICRCAVGRWLMEMNRRVQTVKPDSLDTRFFCFVFTFWTNCILFWFGLCVNMISQERLELDIKKLENVICKLLNGRGHSTKLGINYPLRSVAEPRSEMVQDGSKLDIF